MRVLISDDDRELAETLAACVREVGHEVVAVVTGGGLATIQSFALHRPDVVILDIRMPVYNGLTVSHALRSRDPNVRIIFVSGYLQGDHPFVSTAGATAYLEKPIELELLRRLLASFEDSKAA